MSCVASDLRIDVEDGDHMLEAARRQFDDGADLVQLMLGRIGSWTIAVGGRRRPPSRAFGSRTLSRLDSDACRQATEEESVWWLVWLSLMGHYLACQEVLDASKRIGRHVESAIVVDGVVVSALIVQSVITMGEGTTTGNFTEENARSLPGS